MNKLMDNLTPAARLAAYLEGAPYRNYVYSYPHKTAYRPFAQAADLGELWRDEAKHALFLYLHIPFCEMRCGYCNLFTTTHPAADMVTAYLQTLARQMRVTHDYLQATGDYQFAQLAIGGGTPTYLSATQLHCLFSDLQQYLRVEKLPASVEVSPNTVDAAKLACLREFGVERISIGVESFAAEDLQALGRPRGAVEQALQCVRDSGIPRLNIDLIYGNAGQTPQRWLASLQQALAWSPEELFIYPLYVRPLTGLGQQQSRLQRSQQQAAEDKRLHLYALACDYLQAAGYQQTSMRMFVKTPSHTATNAPQYRCQEDGMIGLGAGARSYTQAWHYSSRYAVGKSSVSDIIQHYTHSTDQALRTADYGMVLDAEDQQRRYVLLSLFQVEGLARARYQLRFGHDVLDTLPELALLVEHGLASIDSTLIRLTTAGMARSDLIGNWLFSERVRTRMAEWVWH